MPSTPLLIGFTIKVSGAATADLNATVRNETTNELTIKTSASDGKVIFNLGSLKDFPSGWNVSDKVSVFSLYRGFEEEFSFTIPGIGVTITITNRSGGNVGSFTGGSGMTVGNLELATLPSAPSLRYFTPTEWLDHLGFKTTDLDAENGIDLLQLTRIGESVEHDIDSDTNTKFDDNNGSFYSPSIFPHGESPEFHDVRYNNQDLYFTKFIPISSVTTFEKNNNAEGVSPDFETLTTANNDIAIDNATGRIKIIDSGEIPEVGIRHVRITYLFGRSTVPRDIKQLAIIETARKMMDSTFLKNKIKNFNDTDLGDISSFEAYRKRIIMKYKNHTISAT